MQFSRVRRLFLMVVAATLVALTVDVGGVEADDTFNASYQGSFFLSFGTGPDGTNELFFSGDGSASGLGDSWLDGESTLAFISADCMEIVTDAITLTEIDDDDEDCDDQDDELYLEASGVDCLDFSDPDQLRIAGSGTIEATGGTGEFRNATGSGTFSVSADILDQTADAASGTFVIHFSGDIHGGGHHRHHRRRRHHHH